MASPKICWTLLKVIFFQLYKNSCNAHATKCMHDCGKKLFLNLYNQFSIMLCSFACQPYQKTLQHNNDSMFYLLCYDYALKILELCVNELKIPQRHFKNFKYYYTTLSKRYLGIYIMQCILQSSSLCVYYGLWLCDCQKS